MAQTSFVQPRRVGPLALIVVALGVAAAVARCTLAFDPSTLPPAPTPDGGTPPACTGDGDCTLANATAACNMGACAISTCAPGFGDCNAIVSDGCETDVRTDVTNCGGCGAQDAMYVCATHANARAVCDDRACTYQCASGQFFDCNGLAADGCEVDLLSTQNCGRCDHACAAPVANCARVPDAGVECTAGCGSETACPGAAGSGSTCVDVQTNPSHCGTCAHACPSGAACVSGACGPCPTGEVACGAACVNTASDPANCGSCGHACRATSCLRSMCL